MQAVKTYDKAQSEGSNWIGYHKDQEMEILRSIQSGVDTKDTADVLDALLQDQFVRQLAFLYAFRPKSHSVEVAQAAIGKLVWETIANTISGLAATHADRMTE